MEKEDTITPICANCNKELPDPAKFCPSCGQKAFDGRIRMRDLLSNMMINIIHLDSKFIKMVWHLFIPGKVTTDYFQGKIQRYPNPFQYFFIIMFFFLLTVNHKCTRDMDKVIQINKTSSVKDSTAQSITPSSIFKGAELSVELSQLQKDYKLLPSEFQTSLAKKAVDSLIAYRKGRIGSIFNSDTISFHLGNKEVPLSLEDMVRLNTDQLIEKYEITDKFDQILTRQSIKAVRDMKSFVNAYLGSISWAILVFIVVMAFVLWLIFKRKRAYYVEHFIFMLHYLSAVLLGVTVIFAVDNWVVKVPEWFQLLFFTGSGIFLCLAMSKFYTLRKRAAFGWGFLLGLISIFVSAFIIIIGGLLVFSIF